MQTVCYCYSITEIAQRKWNNITSIRWITQQVEQEPKYIDSYFALEHDNDK